MDDDDVVSTVSFKPIGQQQQEDLLCPRFAQHGHFVAPSSWERQDRGPCLHMNHSVSASAEPCCPSTDVCHSPAPAMVKGALFHSPGGPLCGGTAGALDPAAATSSSSAPLSHNGQDSDSDASSQSASIGLGSRGMCDSGTPMQPCPRHAPLGSAAPLSQPLPGSSQQRRHPEAMSSSSRQSACTAGRPSLRSTSVQRRPGQMTWRMAADLATAAYDRLLLGPGPMMLGEIGLDPRCLTGYAAVSMGGVSAWSTPQAVEGGVENGRSTSSARLGDLASSHTSQRSSPGQRLGDRGDWCNAPGLHGNARAASGKQLKGQAGAGTARRAAGRTDPTEVLTVKCSELEARLQRMELDQAQLLLQRSTLQREYASLLRHRPLGMPQEQAEPGSRQEHPRSACSAFCALQPEPHYDAAEQLAPQQNRELMGGAECGWDCCGQPRTEGLHPREAVGFIVSPHFGPAAGLPLSCMFDEVTQLNAVADRLVMLCLPGDATRGAGAADSAAVHAAFTADMEVQEQQKQRQQQQFDALICEFEDLRREVGACKVDKQAADERATLAEAETAVCSVALESVEAEAKRLRERLELCEADLEAIRQLEALRNEASTAALRSVTQERGKLSSECERMTSELSAVSEERDTLRAHCQDLSILLNTARTENQQLHARLRVAVVMGHGHGRTGLKQ